jgi:hypothetical protein
MMRRLVQILLVASLFAGSAAQALSCGSMSEDSHPCCRALATLKATAQKSALKKVQPTSFRGGSCGCTSAPETPREKPVSNASTAHYHTLTIPDDELVVLLPFRKAMAQPVRVAAPNDTSPPHFILHSSLLI